MLMLCVKIVQECLKIRERSLVLSSTKCANILTVKNLGKSSIP